jgi:hypothetical protein
MLEYIQSRYLSSSSSINIVDFFILYTTIPHSKLKDRLRELVQLCFIKKNGQPRYKYIVLGRDSSWFVKKTKTIWLYQKVLWKWITNILEVLIDSIFVMLGGQLTYLWVTNCAPLLADLFLYSYEADFIQRLLKKKLKEASPILWFHVPLYRWFRFTK